MEDGDNENEWEDITVTRDSTPPGAVEPDEDGFCTTTTTTQQQQASCTQQQQLDVGTTSRRRGSSLFCALYNVSFVVRVHMYVYL